MSQKFEMVEVHPLFGSCRYASTCIPIEIQKKQYSFHQVRDIEVDENDKQKYRCTLADGSKADYDNVVFASRVFVTSLSVLVDNSSFATLVSLFKDHAIGSDEDDDTRNIIITQLVHSK